MRRDVQMVCGIDPGLQRTGYGVLRVDASDDVISVVDAGIVQASSHDSLGIRLAELAAGIDEVLDENDVQIVAVEQVYSHAQWPRTAILMAHARGVALLEAARRNCQILHLPSTTVKRHVTGNGRASKEQMQRAVMSLLNLRVLPEPPDVADALAIAVCAVATLQHPAKRAAVNDDLLLG